MLSELGRRSCLLHHGLADRVDHGVDAPELVVRHGDRHGIPSVAFSNVAHPTSAARLIGSGPAVPAFRL
eukprot:2826818-Heterocapsa_arctica.AAC.1